ncbi:MAG: hypothetical protein BroJett040_26140 [Oligoflexia bacterium]|nr:MAG: hypothetical protein BroJett040_26140 [Oligoflexia bacterium]
MQEVFLISPIRSKIDSVREQTIQALHRPTDFRVSEQSARDVTVLAPDALPPKKGLSLREGQGRLLHDLASIELQAMEMCFRSLIEYPDAPSEFREHLAQITLEEASHLELCLNGMEKLGYQWGHWPVHMALWQSLRREDSLLDRILIVHRYLEGSGLDAGETLMKRLSGVLDHGLKSIVNTIVTEEVNHVRFGSDWYRTLCQQEKRDPEIDFRERMIKIRYQVPKRIENISVELRKKGGFSDSELQFIEEMRQSIVKYKKGEK